MNVDDTEAPEVTGDRLVMIFDRQRELHEKYVPIERQNGIGLAILPDRFSIDDARCQYVLKDYAWRVTEELTEATEVREHKIHQWEEGIDGLHFYVEMILLAGISPDDMMTAAGFDLDGHDDMLFTSWSQVLEENHPNLLSYQTAAYRMIEYVGRAMNCLKNKPWKQTQMETDVARFEKNLCHAFRKWMIFAVALGMKDEDIFNLYFRKSEVNKFRQRSEY
jgi:hypothetical protein